MDTSPDINIDALLEAAIVRRQAGDILFLTEVLPLSPAQLWCAAEALFQVSAYEGTRLCCERLLSNEAFGSRAEDLKQATAGQLQQIQPNILRIVFTGHLIDAPGRAVPRFPDTDEMEAGEILRKALAHLKLYAGNLIVYLSGACGGDLLFSEACQAFPQISYQMFLPFDQKKFLGSSVACGGAGWSVRFHSALAHAGDVRVLPSVFGAWTQGRDERSYELLNIWMLAAARARSAREALLVGFWDGQQGMPGGTAEFFARARSFGIPVLHLRTPKALREGAADHSTFRF